MLGVNEGCDVGVVDGVEVGLDEGPTIKGIVDVGCGDRDIELKLLILISSQLRSRLILFLAPFGCPKQLVDWYST